MHTYRAGCLDEILANVASVTEALVAPIRLCFACIRSRHPQNTPKRKALLQPLLYTRRNPSPRKLRVLFKIKTTSEYAADRRATSHEAGVNALSHPIILPRSFPALMLSDPYISLFYKALRASILSKLFETSNTTEEKEPGPGGNWATDTLKKLCVAKQVANELSVPHKSLRSLLFLHLWGFNSVLTNSALILVNTHPDSWYNAFVPPLQGAGQWPPVRHACPNPWNL